jgi:hypothetical protein
MNLAKAKDYAENNMLTGFMAVRVEDDQWILHCESRMKPDGYILQTALGKDKVYKTLDALHADVQRILGHSPENWAYRL